MSNLLNSFYSNLNDLISINATDITTDTLTSNSINTTTLKVNGSNINNLFDASYNYIENQIAALQTTLTTCTYDNSTSSFNIGNKLKCLGTFTLYINGVYYNVNTFITDTNNSIQTNTNNITSNTNNIITNTADIQTIKSTLTNVSYNNSTGAFQIGIAGTTDCRILNTLYLYSSGVPYSVNTFVTNTNTNIVSLVNKTTDISYSSGTTTIERLSFNTFINSTSKANFDNVMATCFDISGNCQAQITGAYAAAAAAGVAAAGALTTANAFTTAAIATYATAQSLVDSGQDASIDALEGKLTTYTYNLADNIVSIASRVNCNSFGDLNFTGDLNQTYQATKNNTLRNPTYFLHNVELQNNKGFLIDAGCSFENNGTTTINGALTASATTINGNLTITNTTTNVNATTTQIGASLASTLNTYATSNFYGPTKVRNNSTTSAGLIPPYLDINSILSNYNQRKLQGICIGLESLILNQSSGNIGYNWVSDNSTSNYLYFGLNPYSTLPIEGLRIYPTKVQVPSGNLEISVGNLNILSAGNINVSGTGSISVSAGDISALTGSIKSRSFANITNQDLKIVAASPNNIQLNCNTVQIGTAQAVASANVINVGAITSGSIINLNGTINLNGIVNMALGLQMYNVGDIISQFV